MQKCEKCETNKAKEGSSAIIDNEYYDNICESCLSSSVSVTSGEARWQRTIDAEDREADIQQPYNSDGSINTRFASMYPDKAAALFSAEEIRNANR